MIKQTESQNIGRAGERWFQSILPKEWIFKKPEEDIGIDGKIILGTENFTGGLEFGVQIKSSKSWEIKEGTISVEGIKTDTIAFWGSRLYPTMLVLYDESKDMGYYGWVFDIINHPIEFAVPFARLIKKSITLKMRCSSILSKNSLSQIKRDVEEYYMKFIDSLIALRKSINVLPIVNKLVEAIRGIYLSHMQKPKSSDETMLLDLMMATSHKQVVLSLKELQNKYQLEIGSGNFIHYFITTYINEVNKIINEFDQFVERNKTNAIWINPEMRQKNTPKLIDMILDFMLVLTDDKPKVRGDVFTFR
jgi:hypothetical protein